jgi:hypothetical protein
MFIILLLRIRTIFLDANYAAFPLLTHTHTNERRDEPRNSKANKTLRLHS